MKPGLMKPGMFFWVFCWASLLPVLLPVADARAEILDSGLTCDVDRSSVSLSWNIQFFAPIEAWVISRDGRDIARLTPEATSYLDAEVPDGEHFYELEAINLNANADELPGVIARCVAVVGDFGMECRITALSHVFLTWGPILIDIAIDEFVLRRNGVEIARVPEGQLEYSDRLAVPGLNRYTVHGVSAGNEFLIGACTANLPRAFVCRVDAPNVEIDWSRVALPEIAFRYFEVIRNGEPIARVEPDQSTYIDRPGAGEHHYLVAAITGIRNDDPVAIGAPDYLVGECKVVVPGDNVPPVEDLTCIDLDSEDDRLSAIDIYIGEHDVLLVWQIPEGVGYDRMLITRDGERIGAIPGGQFYFVDRNLSPGVYTYGVHGVIRGQVGRAANCRVAIPRDPLPPPSDLTCQYVGLNADAVVGDQVDGRVILEWQNNFAYQWIVIAKGTELLRVPGNTRRYVDDSPHPGINTYRVFGVVGVVRSEAASCRVDVPIGEVRPPRDLVCLVADDSIDEAGDARPRVFLRWENGDSYDRVVIVRNDTQVALLPGSATSFTDSVPLLNGTLVYEVRGVILNRRSEAARCEVDLGPRLLPSPRDFRCEVDGRFLDAAGQIPVPVVKLSWRNPVPYGALVLSRDNQVLTRLPGDAMSYADINPGEGVHVYGLFGVGSDGEFSEPVRCEVLVGDIVVPPVQRLTCIAVPSDIAGPSAHLRWINPIEYTSILIVRDGERIRELPGESNAFFDPGLPPAVYEYQVIAFVGDLRSRAEDCRVIVPGPPPRNVLYFSSGLFAADEIGDARPDVGNRPGSITAIASNHDPIQGWSLGICHDSAAMTIADARIGRTTAALNDGDGPSFLALDRHKGGVTMAVVIDQEDPSDVLPAENNHRLLVVAYSPSSDAAVGDCHVVRYCSTLGDPPVATLYVVKGFEVEPETRPGRVCFPEPQPLIFVRGDSNADLSVDMSDSVTTLAWLFLGGRMPICLEAADANASGDVNIADPIYTLQWKFSGGPPPPHPFPGCGAAPLVIGCDEPPCLLDAGL